MSNGRMKNGIFLLVIVAIFVVLMSAAHINAGEVDELAQLRQQVAQLQKKIAEAQDLSELKNQLEELSNRITQLEERQKLNEQTIKNKIEEDAEKEPEKSPTDFRVFWKEGLNLATEDGNFKLKIGGRIQNDWIWISEDNDIKTNIGEQEDGTEFRRARMYISGLINGNVEFKAQYDFAGGDADFKDVYIGLTDLPFGGVRVGHFKEPFSLEELTSSKYLTFLERALPNAFAPSRNTGLMFHGNALANSDPRMTWAVGIFRDTPDDGDIRDDGGYNVTTRLTWLPWYNDGGTSMLHLGAAYSHRNPNDDSARFSARPEAHLTDRFVDTSAFDSDDVDLAGLEAAWVSGPMSIQGEYVFANADIASSADFHGYYAQISYFLTGEYRRYKPTEGAFSRVKPKQNYSYKEGGLGAWEVAFRYSGLDLSDSGITGGQLHDMTAGLNWYLNPNTRVMWNYVHSDREDIGYADIFMTRLQIDF